MKRNCIREGCEECCLFFMDYISPVLVLCVMGVVLIGVHEVFSPSGRLPEYPEIQIEVTGKHLEDL